MSYQGKTVLVTGGAGFVGSNLVHRLVKEGAKVYVIDSLVTGYFDNLDGIRDKVFLNQWDIDKKDYYTAPFHGDIVFHLAARNIIASTQDPHSDYQTNIGGTLNMLFYSTIADRFVYTSSASVYGNPRYLPINEDDQINLLTPYAVSKFAGEGYCMAFHESYKTPTTILRLSNVYGPRQRPDNPYCGVVAKFMSAVKDRKPIPIHGNGEQTRDFTYVDDVVDALMLAGEHPRAVGEIFNIASGVETSIDKLADMVIGMENIQKVHIDRRDIDNISRRTLNIEKARRKLGWSPKTVLWEGLAETWKWMNGE